MRGDLVRPIKNNLFQESVMILILAPLPGPRMGY